MSIDSVGGGPKDAAYDSRRRAIEEERNRELDRLEKHHKRGVETASELREKEMTAIYDNMSAESAARQREADGRIASVKAAAESRIRDFEADSARMTDSAKKQFQHKADQLARTSKELDTQRQHLVKQHEDSLKYISQKNEEAEISRRAKYDRESNAQHLRAQHEIRDVQDKSREELNILSSEAREAKRTAMSDADRELRKLQDERDSNYAQLSGQIEFQKLSAAEQLTRERDQFERSRVHDQMQAEAQMSEVNRENSRVIGRTHLRGQKLVKEAADQYSVELDQLRKDHSQKTRDINDRSTLNLQTLEGNARTQEQLAQAGYNIKKQMIDERRDKVLKDAGEQNAALQEKVKTEYSKQSTLLSDSRRKLLDQQATQIQGELKYQRDKSKKQINDSIASAAEKLISHNTKATDPFYRMQAFGAQITDEPTHVTVSLFVPEHEQDTVRVTMQKGSLTLSGTRRFENRAKMEDGHSATTNSYQSYSESFPIAGKLEMNRLTRQYADGRLVFKIPRG